MSLNEEVEILRNIPMFANVEPSKLKLLAFTSERHAWAAGDCLFRQGDTGESAYIIVEGEADVIIDTDDGPLTVAHFGRNALVGEIAILADVPRTATVKATTRLDAMVISRELFFRLVMEFPQIAIEIMRELARRLEATNARIRELSAA